MNASNESYLTEDMVSLPYEADILYLMVGIY